MPTNTKPQKLQEEPILYYESPDAYDRPFIQAPLGTIERQNLFYRLAVLGLRTKTNKLVLTKHSASHLSGKSPLLWGLFVTPVLQDEAKEDACRRIFYAAIGIEAPAIQAIAPFSLPEWPKALAHLYMVELPAGLECTSQKKEGTLLTDSDELEGLTRQLPEMISPEIFWAIKEKCLFR